MELSIFSCIGGVVTEDVVAGDVLFGLLYATREVVGALSHASQAAPHRRSLRCAHQSWSRGQTRLNDMPALQEKQHQRSPIEGLCKVLD
jgi:hypothetical protein